MLGYRVTVKGLQPNTDYVLYEYQQSDITGRAAA